MNHLTREFLRSLGSLLLLGVVCGAIYPLIVLGIAQVAFPRQAQGSLVRDAAGRTVGSHWIGQEFRSARYFHGRPSAAGDGYDAMSSGGSNLGPTSQKLRDQVAARVAAYREENGLPAGTPVPADAVTASASGLDPHISPANARLQAPRVARARQVDPDRVVALIAAQETVTGQNWLGAPAIHVLELNLALDRL